MSLNIDLHVHFVPGPDNPADAPSHCLNLQDSKLSPALWSWFKACAVAPGDTQPLSAEHPIKIEWFDTEKELK